MRKSLKALACLLMVASTFVVPAQAKAVSPCFSDTPDSAWANGEPESVKIALGYDLIGKITSSEEELARYFDPSLFEGAVTSEFVLKRLTSIYGSYIPYTHYLYEGKDCSNREIYVYSSVSTPTTSELPLSQLINKIKADSPNYQESEKSLLLIQKLQKSLKNYSLTIPITKDLFPNYGPYTKLSGLKFQDSSSGLPMNEFFAKLGIVGIVEFDPKCLIFKNVYKSKSNSQPLVKPKYEMLRAYFPLGGPIGVYPFFSSKNAKCVGKFYLSSIQWKEIDSLLPPNTFVFIDKIRFVAKVSNKK